MTSTSYDRTDVFISYSHEDAKYFERLKKHLTPYERSGSLRVWEDTRLSPGSQWRVEIEEAIKKTRIAILLVSADFLASKFIAENELPPLLAAAKTEGTVIIPIILSACAFNDTPLSQFQGINSPSKPLSGMSRNDKEKTWAEIATKVNIELSKASEHKRDWMLSAFNYDYEKTELRGDVRKITPASQLSLMESYPVELFKQFKEDEVFDYTIIDLGTGQKWLTSRLYIFAIMLERMRGLRCFVFLETRDKVDQRFLGIASLTKVRWALARRYPWLETAFARAYAEAQDPGDPDTCNLRILSATGALDRKLAQQVVYNFLQDLSIQQAFQQDFPPNRGTTNMQLNLDDTLRRRKLSLDNGEWEFFTTEDGYHIWEHAKWLDATHLRQDLGDILQQDESAWLKESPDISYTELARSILRCKSPFVALVDEEKRFKSLIDRQDLLERIVANQ